MWPWPHPNKGQFVIPRLVLHMTNQCTIFEISSFSHSIRYFREHRILKWVGDVTITIPHLRVNICHSLPVNKLNLAIYLQPFQIYYWGLQNLQKALLLQRDHTMCFASQNLVNWCTDIRNIPFEMACNRWMTVKKTQGHHHCCYESCCTSFVSC